LVSNGAKTPAPNIVIIQLVTISGKKNKPNATQLAKQDEQLKGLKSNFSFMCSW
jgi:hypothetical protein